MKKIFMLSILAILTITLVGCGNNTTSQGGSAGKIENIPLKEALTKKGSHIWYVLSIYNDEGYGLDKEKKIRDVFIFKDSKVLMTGVSKIVDGESKSLSLGEIAKMTDEEIIKATELYKQAIEETYKKCLDGVEEHCDMEYLKKQVDYASNYKSFKFKIETDGTGNYTKTEFVELDDGREMWSDVYGGYGPYQIYDTYFCGYRGDYIYDVDSADYALITKCKSNTIYTLDKVGTKGIAIDED